MEVRTGGVGGGRGKFVLGGGNPSSGPTYRRVYSLLIGRLWKKKMKKSGNTANLGGGEKPFRKSKKPHEDREKTA